MPGYTHDHVADHGDSVTIQVGTLRVPDRPIIPFVEGDGIGPGIVDGM